MKLTSQQIGILSACLQMPGASIEEIATVTRTKSHVTRYVLEQLRDRRIMTPFYFIKHSLLNLRTYNFFFTVPTSKSSSVLKMLVQDPRVSWIAEYTGKPRFELSAISRDPLEIYDLLNAVSRQTGAHFQDREWAIETESHYFGTRIFGSLGRGVLWSEVSEPLTSSERLTKLDLQIISRLRGLRYGKEPTTAEMAREFKQPVATVSYRVKKLLQSGLLAGCFYFFSLDDAKALQYELVLTLDSTVPKIDQRLLSFCEETVGVNTLIKGFGGWDYKIICDTSPELDGQEIADSLENRFQGVFSNISLRTRRKVIHANTDLVHHPEFQEV